MNKYQAYSEYKDSGIEWFKTIPVHWKIASFSRLFDIKTGGEFNQLCGVTEAELIQLVQQIVAVNHTADKVLSMMRQFYNGYCFCYNLDTETLYNLLSLMRSIVKPKNAGLL